MGNPFDRIIRKPEEKREKKSSERRRQRINESDNPRQGADGQGDTPISRADRREQRRQEKKELKQVDKNISDALGEMKDQKSQEAWKAYRDDFLNNHLNQHFEDWQNAGSQGKFSSYLQEQTNKLADTDPNKHHAQLMADMAQKYELDNKGKAFDRDAFEKSINKVEMELPEVIEDVVITEAIENIQEQRTEADDRQREADEARAQAEAAQAELARAQAEATTATATKEIVLQQEMTAAEELKILEQGARVDTQEKVEALKQQAEMAAELKALQKEASAATIAKNDVLQSKDDLETRLNDLHTQSTLAQTRLDDLRNQYYIAVSDKDRNDLQKQITATEREQRTLDQQSRTATNELELRKLQSEAAINKEQQALDRVYDATTKKDGLDKKVERTEANEKLALEKVGEAQNELNDLRLQSHNAIAKEREALNNVAEKANNLAEAKEKSAEKAKEAANALDKVNEAQKKLEDAHKDIENKAASDTVKDQLEQNRQKIEVTEAETRKAQTEADKTQSEADQAQQEALKAELAARGLKLEDLTPEQWKALESEGKFGSKEAALLKEEFAQRAERQWDTDRQEFAAVHKQWAEDVNNKADFNQYFADYLKDKNYFQDENKAANASRFMRELHTEQGLLQNGDLFKKDGDKPAVSLDALNNIDGLHDGNTYKPEDFLARKSPEEWATEARALAQWKNDSENLLKEVAPKENRINPERVSKRLDNIIKNTTSPEYRANAERLKGMVERWENMSSSERKPLSEFVRSQDPMVRNEVLPQLQKEGFSGIVVDEKSGERRLNERQMGELRSAAQWEEHRDLMLDNLQKELNSKDAIRDVPAFLREQTRNAPLEEKINTERMITAYQDYCEIGKDSETWKPFSEYMKNEATPQNWPELFQLEKGSLEHQGGDLGNGVTLKKQEVANTILEGVKANEAQGSTADHKKVIAEQAFNGKDTFAMNDARTQASERINAIYERWEKDAERGHRGTEIQSKFSDYLQQDPEFQQMQSGKKELAVDPNGSEEQIVAKGYYNEIVAAEQQGKSVDEAINKFKDEHKGATDLGIADDLQAIHQEWQNSGTDKSFSEYLVEHENFKKHIEFDPRATSSGELSRSDWNDIQTNILDAINKYDPNNPEGLNIKEYLSQQEPLKPTPDDPLFKQKQAAIDEAGEIYQRYKAEMEQNGTTTLGNFETYYKDSDEIKKRDYSFEFSQEELKQQWEQNNRQLLQFHEQFLREGKNPSDFKQFVENSNFFQGEGTFGVDNPFAFELRQIQAREFVKMREAWEKTPARGDKAKPTLESYIEARNPYKPEQPAKAATGDEAKGSAPEARAARGGETTPDGERPASRAETPLTLEQREQKWQADQQKYAQHYSDWTEKTKNGDTKDSFPEYLRQQYGDRPDAQTKANIERYTELYNEWDKKGDFSAYLEQREKDQKILVSLEKMHLQTSSKKPFGEYVNAALAKPEGKIYTQAAENAGVDPSHRVNRRNADKLIAAFDEHINQQMLNPSTTPKDFGEFVRQNEVPQPPQSSLRPLTKEDMEGPKPDNNRGGDNNNNNNNSGDGKRPGNNGNNGNGGDGKRPGNNGNDDDSRRPGLQNWRGRFAYAAKGRFGIRTEINKNPEFVRLERNIVKQYDALREIVKKEHAPTYMLGKDGEPYWALRADDYMPKEPRFYETRTQRAAGELDDKQTMKIDLSGSQGGSAETDKTNSGSVSLSPEDLETAIVTDENGMDIVDSSSTNRAMNGMSPVFDKNVPFDQKEELLGLQQNLSKEQHYDRLLQQGHKTITEYNAQRKKSYKDKLFEIDKMEAQAKVSLATQIQQQEFSKRERIARQQHELTKEMFEASMNLLRSTLSAARTD